MAVITVSLTQAAATLGVSRNTLAGWLSKGCPAVKRADKARGVEWELSIPAIFEWRCDTLVREAVATYQTDGGDRISKDEADRRRAVALAIVAEIEADTALRDVVSRTDAEGCMADFCQGLKTGLDNAAHKVAGRTATLSSPQEILEVCHTEFNRSFLAAQEELYHLWALAADGKPGDANGEDI